MRRMSLTQRMIIRPRPGRRLRNRREARDAAGSFEHAATAATIHAVDEAKPKTPSESDARLDKEMEESRLLMMRRVKRMSVEERVELFERLSRDAALILSSAKRIR